MTKSIPDFMRGVTGGDTPADAKAEGRCLRPPIGCGRQLMEAPGFMTTSSLNEYRKTGLCAECQDRVWALISEEDCE